MAIIHFKDVWEMYRIKFITNGKVSWENFWALKGINFEVGKGESIGIIGENGAGKSTILKLIMGMLKPDRGEIKVLGKVSGLLELGAGFQAELTGRDNIYLNAGLFGLTKEDINSKFNEIVEFSGIGRFIDAQIKSYSQGMFVRLAFSIAIHINPDILLIDDTLAVGDEDFQRKCIKKMFELRETGKAIIFVTHDMDMAKRLCKRAVLLKDGAIIKDGPIDIVCSYYAEIIGNKKGVGILKKEPLAVIFNNGKLILRWKDKTIMCELSGHSMMVFSGRKYFSHTADWQIQKLKAEEGITATGEWPDIPISQHWKIVLLNEKEFLWEIMIRVNEKTAIEKYETKFIFIDEYKSWFAFDNEKNFPETFIHEKEWECSLVDNSIDAVIGLKGSNDAVTSLPIVLLDRSNENIKAICQVGNTGSEIHGRVVQYQVFPKNLNFNYIGVKYRYFLCKVKIFDPEEKEKLTLYLNNAKQVMQESKIIRGELISLFCKEQKIEIYWRDKLISRGIGLNTKFRCRDKNYSALDGCWNIHKESDEEIIITISWNDKPPFIQIWKLKLKNDDTILWKIEMHIDEKIRLRNKQTELVLSEEYEKWITTEERGDFKRLEKKGNAVLLTRYINNHIGVESIYKTDNFVLPGILFKYENSAPKISHISKLEEEMQVTRLRYLEIDSEENFYTLPGKYEYFNGEVKVVGKEREYSSIKIRDEKSNIINNRQLVSFGKIELKRMSLVFDYGKGRIFWDGLEFTKGLGLYSSVFFKNNWYDSTQAFWVVQILDKTRLVAIGRWSWVSLIQTWEISILDEKTLLWKVAKETWEDIILEKEQINLMVSERYKKWFVHKQFHGKFPESFSEHNGLYWDKLWFEDRALPIGIKKCKIKKGILSKQFFPSVLFSCVEDCRVHYSVIENTDNLFQARILQYELNSSKKNAYNGNKDKYFTGQIKIIT